MDDDVLVETKTRFEANKPVMGMSQHPEGV